MRDFSFTGKGIDLGFLPDEAPHDFLIDIAKNNGREALASEERPDLLGNSWLSLAL